MEGENGLTSSRLLDPAYIRPRSVVPRISKGLVRTVERRVRHKNTPLKRISVGDTKAMPVACDAEDDLIGRETGGSPCCDGAHG